MKTHPKNAIGQVFGHRWTVPILVAVIWATIVTLYVLGGLRPHGFIGDETEALSTWLGWMAGGSILLVWVMWKFYLDNTLRLHSLSQGAPYHPLTADSDDESEDLLPVGREDRNRDNDPYWNPTYATSIFNAWHRND